MLVETADLAREELRKRIPPTVVCLLIRPLFRDGLDLADHSELSSRLVGKQIASLATRDDEMCLPVDAVD